LQLPRIFKSLGGKMGDAAKLMRRDVISLLLSYDRYP